MSEIHIFKCDKCDLKVIVTNEHFGYFENPKGWVNRDNLDLCPKCAKKYDRLIESFIENERSY